MALAAGGGQDILRDRRHLLWQVGATTQQQQQQPHAYGVLLAARSAAIATCYCWLIVCVQLLRR
jgi:hypothetical protein